MIHHRPQFDHYFFRRSYLISSGAVGSSMVLSLSLPLDEGNVSGAESSAPNAFIRIDRAGRVVLTMPRLEIGRGIYTSIRMLIAEELEVVPNRVELEYAPARVMLIAAAAKRWGVDARSCHAYGGEVIHAPTWRKFKYGELAIDAAYMLIPKEVALKGASGGKPSGSAGRKRVIRKSKAVSHGTGRPENGSLSNDANWKLPKWPTVKS